MYKPKFLMQSCYTKVNSEHKIEHYANLYKKSKTPLSLFGVILSTLAKPKNF